MNPAATLQNYLVVGAILFGLGMIGFLLAGLTDYSYGHSLGLILFSFVALAPLQQVQASSSHRLHHVEHLAMEPVEAEPCPARASRGAGDSGQPLAIIR